MRGTEPSGKVSCEPHQTTACLMLLVLEVLEPKVQKTAIALLDEPTSALDSGTEKAVLGALFDLAEGRTCIVVAHRLSTAARCDKIVVLDKGRVVEWGTHAELIGRSGGAYAELWRKQSDHDQTEVHVEAT